jgi:N-acetylmuramoyl-L-alanine amidase
VQKKSRRKVVLIRHLFLLLLIFSGNLFAQNNTQVRLINIETQSQPSPQIILTFDKPVNYKVFSLPQPSRLVLDLARTQYDLQKSAHIDFTQTDITDFRHGIQDGYNLRIVFDLKQVIHYNTEVHQGQNFQVIIHLTQQQPSTPKIKKILKVEETQKIDTNPPASVVIPPPKKEKFIVVIDAGHGGRDSGAKGPEGILEKDVTLSIAKDLQTLVDSQPNMKAVLTRKNDAYISLRQRLALARKAKGDLFVAIHADAFEETDARGASVYALSLHGSTNEAALWLSQKENYSELGSIDLGGIENDNSEIRSVLIDLSQAATISASLKLGQDTLKQLGKITDLHHDCVEQAPFMVLKSPDIPSVLVETGFITNPEEETRLKTHDYQEKLANALMSGIKAYCQQNSELVQKQHSTAYTRSVDEI